MDDTDRPRDPKTMQVLEELSLLKSHLFGAYNIYPFPNPNLANKTFLPGSDLPNKETKEYMYLYWNFFCMKKKHMILFNFDVLLNRSQGFKLKTFIIVIFIHNSYFFLNFANFHL